MKKQLLFVVALLGCLTSLRSTAQVGIGTTTPDPSAQLDIQSPSKGVLVPRVASTASVTATSEGLLVYQTSAPAGFYVYKGAAWVRLATADDVAVGGGDHYSLCVRRANHYDIYCRGIGENG